MCSQRIGRINGLLRLRKTHIKPAAEMCAQAFQDDPLFTYLIPDPWERKSKSVYISQWFIRYGVLYGEAYATSHNFEGAAVWIPYGEIDMTLWRAIRSGWFALYFKLGKECLLRLSYVTRFINSMYRRHAPFPNWYLQFLGVDPVFQGQGYASILIRAMFARADQEHLPCYVDTQNEKNVPMYKHFGFRIIEETIIPGTGIRHWVMRRDKSA